MKEVYSTFENAGIPDRTREFWTKLIDPENPPTRRTRMEASENVEEDTTMERSPGGVEDLSEMVYRTMKAQGRLASNTRKKHQNSVFKTISRKS